MPGQFTIRFYRLKDKVMCDRTGAIASGEDLVHTATLDEARSCGHDFVARHPALGCLLYRPDGRFAERIPGSQPGSRRKPTRRRSWLLAGAQLLPAAALVWWDAANDFGLILPTLLATRLIYGGLFKAVDGVLGPDEEQAES